MNEFYLHVLPVEILQRFRNNRRRVQTMVFFCSFCKSISVSPRAIQCKMYIECFFKRKLCCFSY